MINKPIAIIGMPIHLGQGLDGVDLGPKAIRYASLYKKLREMGYEVRDVGDLPIPRREDAELGEPNLKYVTRIKEANELLANKVEEVLSSGEFPLLLGGDHSMAIGTITGLRKQYRRLGLIWVDAHGDLNTAETTPSGNIHGMSLAVSLGLGHPDLVGLGGISPKVLPKNTVIVGARDLDAGERELICQLGVHVFTTHDIERMGISSVMDKTLQIVTSGTEAVHVSFDVDSMDPKEVIGTGTRVPGGLTYRESQLLLRIIADANVLCSAEFVEVNPLLDHENKTAKVTVELIRALLGEKLTNSFKESEMVEVRR